MDSHGFWEASWGGKSSQEASKMAPEKQRKNENRFSKNGPAHLPKPDKERTESI